VEPGTITVRGAATAPGRPDDLRIGLTIVALAPAPDLALDDVSRRAEQLQAILDGAGVASGDRSTSAVAVGEVREWDGNRQVHRGYRAAAKVVVRMVDAAGVGPLLARAMAEVAPEVSGPAWRLAPGNPAYVEACRLAVDDARRRAEAYAGALGRGLGPVVALAEVGTAGAGGGRMMLAAGDFDQPGATGLPVEPGDIDVAAAVEVVFGLDPPYAR
jgi:uncharacterized protein YggE